MARLPVRAEDLPLVAGLAQGRDVAAVELVLQLVEELRRVEQPPAAERLRAVELLGVPEVGIADRQDVAAVEALADGREALVGEAVEGLLSPGGDQPLLAAVLPPEPVGEPLGGLATDRRARPSAGPVEV